MNTLYGDTGSFRMSGYRLAESGSTPSEDWGVSRREAGYKHEELLLLPASAFSLNAHEPPKPSRAAALTWMTSSARLISTNDAANTDAFWRKCRPPTGGRTGAPALSRRGGLPGSGRRPPGACAAGSATFLLQNVACARRASLVSLEPCTNGRSGDGATHLAEAGCHLRG